MTGIAPSTFALYFLALLPARTANASGGTDAACDVSLEGVADAWAASLPVYAAQEGGGGAADAEQKSKAKPPPTEARVVDVYDGDTCTLANGDRVRFRWINTPELRPEEAFADEAREALASRVLGKRITLHYGNPVRDKYDRLVADVRLDGESIALALLREGVAHIMMLPPYEEGLEYLFEAQTEAREAERGIWGHDRYQGVLHITSFHANASGNDRRYPENEYLRVCNISDEPVSTQGYQISDIRGRTYSIPAVTIPPGHTVEIHSGTGEHQVDPKGQLSVYLGTDGPVWNNLKDRATLYDAGGEVVDTRLHEVQN